MDLFIVIILFYFIYFLLFTLILSVTTCIKMVML